MQKGKGCVTKDMDAENEDAGDNSKLTGTLDPATIAAPMDINADIDDEVELVNVNVDNTVQESEVKGIMCTKSFSDSS